MRIDDENTPGQMRQILDFFWKIAAVPRCSGNEEAIADFLLRFAEENGFPAVRDLTGNVLVRVPASPGDDKVPPAILQTHMDMVCVAAPESTHDFSRDPIVPVIRDEWLRAQGTTLGADNGIGMALALTAAVAGIRRPPLELLFTVDEERGLSGAAALSPEFIRGRTLINLDSEDEGVLTIGCAGGRDGSVTLPLERDSGSDKPAFTVSLEGLAGGHSGVEIHKQRANAIQMLAGLLEDLRETAPGSFRLHGISGGNARNAVPAAAAAVVSATDPERLLKELRLRLDTLIPDLNIEDRNAGLDMKDAPGYRLAPLRESDTGRLLALIRTLPHGVARMSSELPGVVETSSNVALCETAGDVFRVVFSLRSFLGQAMEELGKRFVAAARLAGGESSLEAGYPGWIPDFDAPLLKMAAGVYRDLLGSEPEIEVVHAGLECGVIGKRIPGMAMLSIGPTIEEPHTPEERLHLPSLDRFWTFFRALLAALSE